MKPKEKEQLIERVIETMCDKFCRFTAETNNQEELDERCDECPLHAHG